MSTLQLGSTGDDVKRLQRLLQTYKPDLVVSGEFDPPTERAVRWVQRRNGIYPPDGIADDNTMQKLNGVLSSSPTGQSPGAAGADTTQVRSGPLGQLPSLTPADTNITQVLNGGSSAGPLGQPDPGLAPADTNITQVLNGGSSAGPLGQVGLSAGPRGLLPGLKPTVTLQGSAVTRVSAASSVTGPRHAFLQGGVSMTGANAATPRPIATGLLKQAISAAQRRAKKVPMPNGTVHSAKGMSLSPAGLAFIYAEEAQRGVSNHLYWPKGASGVTIGAGYDMKFRTRQRITDDLVGVGVPPKDAALAAECAGLSDAKADYFCNIHRHLLNLTDDQQMRLLSRTVGPYVERVRHAITVPLHQYEFDALVSFSYNPGTAHAWHTAIHAINQRHIHQAMTAIASVSRGIHRRRMGEIRLYTFGEYN